MTRWVIDRKRWEQGFINFFTDVEYYHDYMQSQRVLALGSESMAPALSLPPWTGSSPRSSVIAVVAQLGRFPQCLLKVAHFHLSISLERPSQ